ncbi:hypothetical protein [Thiothrix fructosivorans]|uniref:Uncharacterized protein n=1 Tax=Thiothrix fructosivorans TaxID=111770 RepID=A0A8B0SI76_9GAMM|nr:hypothetical protein [Thiothrix fructosivorans]MBO0615386.1 hypothetical protein [Thiothrix fructosivorans]QTX10160.1 hypothetical protein J1836_016430 [Thiothrix fructosivorans]
MRANLEKQAEFFKGQPLLHRNGWMTETDAAWALGGVKPLFARRLPIPRTNVSKPNSRRTCNRYRVEDVLAYLQANTAAPAPTAA